MPTETVESAPEKPPTARWGQERRLVFIDFRLAWEGRINRSDLTSFFGISVPQASLDLARYIELAPGNAEYDRSEKVYLASASFNPIRVTRDSSRFLNQLLAVSTGMMSREMSFLGWYPDFDAVLSPTRSIDPQTLFTVLQAIRNKRTIQIEYQSLTRLEPTKRKVSPHAVAYDGSRWHTRAYCHQRKGFRDFVFARILKIEPDEPSDIQAKDDVDWHTTLMLEIGPHPKLPETHKKVIELDYGMENGKKAIPCKKSLLFYVLRRFNLDRQRDTDAQPERRKEATPQALQIVLLNRKQLEEHLRDVQLT